MNYKKYLRKRKKKISALFIIICISILLVSMSTVYALWHDVIMVRGNVNAKVPDPVTILYQGGATKQDGKILWETPQEGSDGNSVSYNFFNYGAGSAEKVGDYYIMFPRQCIFCYSKQC